MMGDQGDEGDEGGMCGEIQSRVLTGRIMYEPQTDGPPLV